MAAAQPPGWNDRSSLDVHWNNKGLSIRGLAVIFVLAVLAIIASNLYAGFRIERVFLSAFNGHAGQMAEMEARAAKAHELIRTTQDRTSCLLSMNPLEREQFRKNYHLGAFKVWCPWVEE